MSTREQVMENPYSLLDPEFLHITEPDNWSDLSKQRRFYLRGVTWFRKEILSQGGSANGAGAYIEPMRLQLMEIKPWHEVGLDFVERYGKQQFGQAISANRKTSQFSKALQSLLICDLMLKDFRDKFKMDIEIDAVYENMRIEPAISYIPGLDEKLVNTLILKYDEEYRSAVVEATGQHHCDFVLEMAERHTCTKRLAERTYGVLCKFDEAKARISKPSMTFNSQYHNRKPPLDERVEVPDSELK